MKTSRELHWCSASHFHNGSKFPAVKYSTRYHKLVGIVMQELGKIVPVNNNLELEIPPHNFESIQTLTALAGFKTHHLDTFLDSREEFQVMLTYLLFAYTRSLLK